MNQIAKSLLVLSVCAGAAASATAGEVLSPLDPTVVDDTYFSVNDDNLAEIDFVNQASFPVDVYWINFNGDRVLYYPGLAPGSSYDQETFITHPWLIVETGTGGTTDQGTGDLITAFLPVTPNPDYNPDQADVAYITGSVPERPSWLVPVTAFAALALFRRKFAVLA